MLFHVLTLNGMETDRPERIAIAKIMMLLTLTYIGRSNEVVPGVFEVSDYLDGVLCRFSLLGLCTSKSICLRALS